ncbi:hypothetical protein CFP56_012637 [Quercus suber]|uniref:Uncharacterized protein n=1 Tax=Quercus suber TaxID=58331 RepID=A0AAW0KV79_QUESU
MSSHHIGVKSELVHGSVWVNPITSVLSFLNSPPTGERNRFRCRTSSDTGRSSVEVENFETMLDFAGNHQIWLRLGRSAEISPNLD